MMGKKDRRHDGEQRVLDVDAAMQGSLVFKDPVNLRINGKFEGILNTKGNLMISEHASVAADITGESIVIAGRVNGNINALKELKLIAPACVVGDIKTPLLSVAEGAILEGNCHMSSKEREHASQAHFLMTPEDLAKYLEVESAVIFEWVKAGKLPAIKEGDNLRFERAKIDEWVASGKIK